jgi:hypothetical protein
LLESTGYTVRTIEWLEGYYGTLSYQLRVQARDLPIHPRYYGGRVVGVASAAAVLMLKPLFAISSILFSRLDLRYKFVSAGHCKNYTIVAIKGNKGS